MRRRFLNYALACTSQYVSATARYHRVLRQRNAELKRVQKPEALQSWTELLVGEAEEVWSQRRQLISYVNHHLPRLYADLFGEELSLTVELLVGAPDDQGLQEALASVWEQEQRYRYTLYGPHRDDFEVRVDGRSAQSVLSRGQARSVVIAFKLAIYQYTKKVVGVAPLVLLDEVLSELDAQRQKRLLSNLPNTQILLTCTTIPDEIKRQSNVHLLDIAALVTEEGPGEVAKETVPVSLAA